MDDWRRGLLLAAAAVVIAALWVGRREARSQPAPAVAAEPETISLLLEFGVNDRAPRAWDGRLRVSGGRLLGLRLWRPRPGDQVSEASWKLASRQGANFVRRVWEPEPPTPVVPYVNSTGVVAELSGEVASVDVTTPHGNFTLTPKSIEPGRPAAGAERRGAGGSGAQRRPSFGGWLRERLRGLGRGTRQHGLCRLGRLSRRGPARSSCAGAKRKAGRRPRG